MWLELVTKRRTSMTLFGSTNAQIESPRNVLTYFGQIIDALAHHVTSVLVRNKGNDVLEELKSDW